MFLFFKQKTAYEIMPSLVGSEMCIRDRPGGDLAARQPWRNLLAHCLAFVPDWQDYPQAAPLRQRNWPLLAQAIDRGINAPRASSCGRLFDAVACALDCAPESLSYEGEAACRLEALSLIHISEPTRLGMISYAVFCLKKKKKET